MFSREFDQGRREQGFRSQAHLDAWFRYFDHTQACDECKKPGEPVFIDDGYQPTQKRCETARVLDRLVDTAV